MTICNAIGCTTEVSGMRDFVCPKHVGLVPKRLMENYLRACKDIQAIRSRLRITGMQKSPEAYADRLLLAYMACREAVRSAR